MMMSPPACLAATACDGPERMGQLLEHLQDQRPRLGGRRHGGGGHEQAQDQYRSAAHDVLQP
jgi:hypothetical protein